MEIKIKKLSETAKIPTRADIGSAGYDIYADIPNGRIDINGHETILINTGIAAEIPQGYFGAIYARSGLASKDKLRPGNCVGVIDASYRGEIKVALHNDNGIVEFAEVLPRMGLSSEVYDYVPTINALALKYIKHGDRIAQLVIQKCEDIEFVEVDELSASERGDGGFGSTGKD